MDEVPINPTENKPTIGFSKKERGKHAEI